MNGNENAPTSNGSAKDKDESATTGSGVTGYRQNASLFKSILKLKEEKRSLEFKLQAVETMLQTGLTHKQQLSDLNVQLKTWAERIQAANRNNQGVPYVRDIRDICNKILADMRRGDFKNTYDEKLVQDVPCFRQVFDGLENLEKLCSKVLQNEANYKATWVEEMRQLIGRLIGSTNAILDLYFEE